MSFYGTPDFDIQKMPECSVKDFLLCLDEEIKLASVFDNPEKEYLYMPDFTTFKIRLHGKKGDKDK